MSYFLYSDPNAAVDDDVDICWPQYEANNRYYALLRSNPSVSQHYQQQRVQFWTNVMMKLVESDPLYTSKL
jgi:hypothetical protein